MGEKQRAFLSRKTHKHNDKDDFRTPDYIIRWLKSQFGEGLRDGACTPNVNNKGVPIDLFDPYSRLSYAEWVYVNPPFDMKNVVMFVEACARISAGNDVVMLLPNKLCSKSYCLKVNHHFDEIIMLGGRIDFESPYAAKGGTSMNGCFVGIMYADIMKKTEYPIVKCVTLAELKVGFD